MELFSDEYVSSFLNFPFAEDLRNKKEKSFRMSFLFLNSGVV